MSARITKSDFDLTQILDRVIVKLPGSLAIIGKSPTGSLFSFNSNFESLSF